MEEYAGHNEAKIRNLKNELDRKFQEWEAQRKTIEGFHDVCRKHCPRFMASSEELDKYIEGLKKTIKNLMLKNNIEESDQLN